MKYCSTRGSQKNLSFEHILFRGYAEDGGLFMPQYIPCLHEEKLNELRKASYSDIVKTILRLFIDDLELSTTDLNFLVDKAHLTFSDPDIVKISKLNDGLNIAELYHGETLAFKDLALSVVGRLYEYFFKKNKRRTIILVGTSGDTGSSAIQGVRSLEGINIIVLYPKGYCTEIQELQMVTVTDDNVHCFAVEGTSDELDVPIKLCYADKNYVEKYNISSLNSINWGRIAVQVAHYFYIYFKLCRDKPLEIIVPSGAAGNLTAGYIANLMGLPITLVASTNGNKRVFDFVNTGEIKEKEKVLQTMAPAMDIQVPYNLERLVYLASEGDTEAVSFFMSKFYEDQNVTISNNILHKLKQVIKDASFFSDATIKDTILRCWQENDYRICPHTAVAVAYHYSQNDNSKIRVCIATASADKFPDALASSGVPPSNNTKLMELHELDKKYDLMKQGQNWLSILQNKIDEIWKNDSIYMNK